MGLRLLKFEATWCQPCKILDPIIEQVKSEITSVSYETYDSEKDTAEFSQYKVSSVPTIIIMDGDVEKERVVGVVPKPKLISLINKYSA
jgi:thioredoxin 1